MSPETPSAMTPPAAKAVPTEPAAAFGAPLALPPGRAAPPTEDTPCSA